MFILLPNYWFSDDSIRHIYDAYYFLHQIDPFQVSPLEVGKVPGIESYPNHPHLTTIYFPFTQLVGFISIYLANLIYQFYGIALFEVMFRIGFYVIELLLIFWIIKKNPQYLSFFLTPIFLVESLSCHTDIHGILIFILILVAKSVYISGIFLPILLFIKPEGWIIFINFFIGILYRFLRNKLYKKVYIFLFLNFISIGTFLLVLYFFYYKGYISIKTFYGLLKQADIYHNNFLAYQPFILILQNLFGWDATVSIQYYRKNLFLIFVIGLVILFLWRNHPKEIIKKHLFTKPFFYKFILLQLSLFFLYKASWQPWYFLWFFPLLWKLKYFEFINIFSAILLLWYIPVVFLHIKGSYHYSVFFGSLVVWLLYSLTKIYFKRNKNPCFN